MVKQKICLKGIRVLFTQQTLELIIYDFKSFVYDRLRKTDYVERAGDPRGKE
jgi:hypothetical protein